MKQYMSISSKRQAGAILIISLIMLLLLTIIGLASIRGTSLQERMANNYRDSELAMQAAEAGLRKGEQDVVALFMANNLGVLETSVRTGTYTSFPGTTTAPTYEITLLAKLRTSTEVGVPIADEGAVVRVESTGYGINQKADGTASSNSRLRTTYLVEQ